MAMSIVPEEFPVVLTVFLALGAWRISRSRVLTRRMPAVETLGAATVLCVDKTGTLTQNQMTLRRLVGSGRSIDLASLNGPLPDELEELLENAILASKRDPFDPMERALHAAGARLLNGSEHLHPEWSLAREYPLRPGMLAVGHAWDRGALEAAERVLEERELALTRAEGSLREIQGKLALVGGAVVKDQLREELEALERWRDRERSARFGEASRAATGELEHMRIHPEL